MLQENIKFIYSLQTDIIKLVNLNINPHFWRFICSDLFSKIPTIKLVEKSKINYIFLYSNIRLFRFFNWTITVIFIEHLSKNNANIIAYILGVSFSWLYKTGFNFKFTYLIEYK